MEDTTTKFLHMSTGFGGGKTHSLIKKMMQLSHLNRPYHGGLVVPSFTDFTKDVLPELEDICDKSSIEYHHQKKDNWIQFPWTQGKVYVVSAEKKIRGPTWAYACINEVTLLTAERYKETIGRIRKKGAKCTQLATSGTPEGTGHWLYDVFMENPMKNSRVIYGDTRDNAENLSPDYIQSLMDSYDSVMLDAYLKGMWVNMNGRRFYYNYEPDRHHDKQIKRDPEMINQIAMDFNVDPMAASIWNFDGARVLGFDEVKIMDGDTEKMCIALKSRGYVPDNSVIYPDPSGNSRSTKGRSDVKILKDHGYEVVFRPTQPRHRQRQLNMNNLFEKRKILINPDKMPGCKKDFAAVSVDVVTLGKAKKDQNLTHFSDGVDYMCDILFPFSGKKPQIRSQQYR